MGVSPTGCFFFIVEKLKRGTGHSTKKPGAEQKMFRTRLMIGLLNREVGVYC